MPKPKNPVTPLPLPPKLRTALYGIAGKKSRKLTAHILAVLQEHVDAERAK